MKQTLYPVIFHPEDTGYTVTAPDFDGCFSQGDTLAEVYANISDAIGLCLEVLADDGVDAPVPSSPAELSCLSPDFVAFVSFDPAAYLRRHNAKLVKKTLTIPAWLNALAEEQHVNFSGVLQDALMQKLGV